MRTIRRSRLLWLICGAALAFGVIGVGGPWLYINVLTGPAPMRFAVAEPEGDALWEEPNDLDGTWIAGVGSVAGYRVEKRLAGQATEAVGRTEAVIGRVVILDSSVAAGEFEVELASMRSDSAQRDAAFRGRIMDVEQWPVARFVLGGQIEIPDDARRGGVLTGALPGTLYIRGRAEEVAFDIEARLLRNGTIDLVARYVAPFDTWGIANPSQPGVIVREEALLEIQLVLERER